MGKCKPLLRLQRRTHPRSRQAGHATSSSTRSGSSSLRKPERLRARGRKVHHAQTRHRALYQLDGIRIVVNHQQARMCAGLERLPRKRSRDAFREPGRPQVRRTRATKDSGLHRLGHKVGCTTLQRGKFHLA